MQTTQLPVQSLRHILFDLDGTLVDSVRITCAIIDAMLADRGIDHRADPAVARTMDAVGGAAMIRAVMGPHCRDAGSELADFRARHAVVATPPDLAFPGVASALARLAGQGIGLGICSNKPQMLCEKILGDLGLAGHFAAIVGSRPDLPRKPAPDAARLALAQMGASQHGCIYVGDSVVDVHTAAAVSLPVALVAWGYGIDAAQAAAPQAVVLQQLMDLVSD